MTENTDLPEPKYSEGDTVYTIEGVRGTVAEAPTWHAVTEQWSYDVEWSDGADTTELESFFAEDDVEFEAVQ